MVSWSTSECQNHDQSWPIKTAKFKASHSIPSSSTFMHQLQVLTTKTLESFKSLMEQLKDPKAGT